MTEIFQENKSIKYKAIIIFLLIGVFSKPLSMGTCYFLLDNLDCNNYIQFICNGWDQFEYWIASKAIALVYYWIGLHGFVGAILYSIEERFLKGWINSFLGGVGNIFGISISAIITMLLINYFGDALGLYDLFDFLYGLFNNKV